MNLPDIGVRIFKRHINLIIFVQLLLILYFLAADVSHARLRDLLGSRDKDYRIEVQWIADTETKSAGFIYGPGDYGRKLFFDGQMRFYEIHVPPQYDKDKSFPSVLVFHGGGGDPGSMRYVSKMDKTSDREGFIVIYPAGTNKRPLLKNRLLLWNDGRPNKDGTHSKIDDVGFVMALLEDMGKLYNIDSNRIYATGYSNGAQFTYRLAKRRTDVIAAIALIAGQRPANDSFDPLPSRPVSVMQFSGLEDKIGPYHGGRPPEAAELTAITLPVTETIKSWAEFNKCDSKAEERRIGKAVETRYGDCQDGTEVILWTLEDGGHTWPGGKEVPNVEMLGMGKLGNFNRDISASDLMWKFFKKHPLKPDEN